MTRQELIKRLESLNPGSGEEGEVVVLFFDEDTQQFVTQPIVDVSEEYFIYLVAESAT